MSGLADRPSRVTIREIADLAGVSIATVSRVVNGHSDVSEETREHVNTIVREHGYATNRSARGGAVDSRTTRRVPSST